jgi:putative transposase
VRASSHQIAEAAARSRLDEKEREGNAFQSTCHYIRENPVRKELVLDWAHYTYSGCIVPGYPERGVRAEGYGLRFWRVYTHVRKLPLS